MPSQSAGRSSTSVRVPGRVARRGCLRAGARTDNAVFVPACSSPLAVAQRPRVAARSPMSGVSVAGDDSGQVGTRNARPVSAGSPAAGRRTSQGSCRSIRQRLFTSMRIPTFRCAAPARCGAMSGASLPGYAGGPVRMRNAHPVHSSRPAAQGFRASRCIAGDVGEWRAPVELGQMALLRRLGGILGGRLRRDHEFVA
jgi:hypothetical protein